MKATALFDVFLSVSRPLGGLGGNHVFAIFSSLDPIPGIPQHVPRRGLPVQRRRSRPAGMPRACPGSRPGNLRLEANSEDAGESVLPGRCDGDAARAFGPSYPTLLQVMLEQGGSERAGDMVPAFAPIQAGPA